MNIKDIGRAIRQRRILLKVSQKALGEISGVSVHALSNIESGKGNPTVKSLNQILDALGMELKTDVRIEKRTDE
jgi:transcriptional regulator with XRE-family HTH domain